MRRTVAGLMLTLALATIFTFGFNIRVAKAGGTICIRADGSIDPPDAPISNIGNVTYTFMDNINGSIVVERSNIAVDGNGHAVWGSGSGYGFTLTSVSNVTIGNVHIKNFGEGIYLDHSLDITISRNNITNNWYGIGLEHSSNTVVSGNNITASMWEGVLLINSSSSTIFKNNVTNNEYGIRLSSSFGNSIFGNNLAENSEDGIRLYNSSNNEISGNNITENSRTSYLTGGGIDLYISNSNNITGNALAHNGNGIFLEYSGYNSVRGNLITDNHCGVILKTSTGNVLRSNNMTDNNYNMGIYGIDDDLFNFGGVSLSSFVHDIDSSNTVNGKPVCYWVNQHGNRIPEDAGFVAAVNCSRITVSNIRPTKNVQGILFAFTTNSVLQNLTVADNEVGVHLVCSDNNIITASNVTGNKFGISLYYSSRNDFTQNIVTENDYFGVGLGIGLAGGSSTMFPPTTITSEGNLFRGNMISNNAYWWGGGLWLSNPGTRYTIIVDNNITDNNNGVHLRESFNNSIYHNNFVDNYPQVYVETSGYANFWDNGVEGNYWSNYTGVDVKSGFYQNETGSDGIGDTPHIIDANNADNRPLMAPIRFFDAGTWNDTTFYVSIVSNSTLSNFHFNPDEGAFASFWVKGETETETRGFCRVAIPKSLLWVKDGWTVLYGSYPLSHKAFSDENYTYLYFTYTNPSQNGFTIVTINGTHVIPEFPSFLVLPPFMIATLLTVIVQRKRRVNIW
jgi:parallel beta-helix repeat protein